jgi:hypothetical protein
MSVQFKDINNIVLIWKHIFASASILLEAIRELISCIARQRKIKEPTTTTIKQIALCFSLKTTIRV